MTKRGSRGAGGNPYGDIIFFLGIYMLFAMLLYRLIPVFSLNFCHLIWATFNIVCECECVRVSSCTGYMSMVCLSRVEVESRTWNRGLGRSYSTIHYWPRTTSAAHCWFISVQSTTCAKGCVYALYS